MTKNTGGSPINPMKPRSGTVTDGLERAPARGMLRAVGMGDEDWAKPQIGIASSWNEITPCNLSLDRLAKASKEGVHQAGGFPLQFGTISVSDGISMGHEGMHFSLVSREIIADSVETVMQAERLDGMVLFAGCDKSLPGMMMAAARLDVAAVFVYAGSTLPGNVDGKDVTIIDAFEAVGACARGLITQDQVDRIERAICPGEGACGGMYTANTMASAIEALGMSLPNSSAQLAIGQEKRDDCARAGGEVVLMNQCGCVGRRHRHGLKTRDCWVDDVCPRIVGGRTPGSSLCTVGDQLDPQIGRVCRHVVSLSKTWAVKPNGCRLSQTRHHRHNPVLQR